MLDHEMVAAQKMTERYLLDELDPAVRDEFEEHYFNCSACAADVQTGSLLVEQIREGAIADPELRPVPVPARSKPERPWLAWMRPAFVVPVMAMLLAIVGYQNLVTYPQMAHRLNSPQVLPWAQVSLNTYGAEEPITARPGQSFLLLVRIPPSDAYSRYTAELYNPAGKVEWSVTFPASSTQDEWPLQVPGANRAPGKYDLKIRAIKVSGESKDVGTTSFELRIQN